MAFVEKTSTGPVNSNAPSSLRTTTRLDPMTYMLFGAYHLNVTAQGLVCDDWLPIQGSLDSLDEVRRLKGLLDTCMLRVFEGVGQGLVKGRSERSHRPAAQRRVDDSDDEGEHEIETERDGKENEDRSLSETEIIELDNLTSDVVAILDRYALERGAGVSRASTRPSTPAITILPRQDNPPPASFASYENAPYRPPVMRNALPMGPRGGGGRPVMGAVGAPPSGAMLPPGGPRGGFGGPGFTRK